MADGDPASDVLAGAGYFVPSDAHASVTAERRLIAVLGAASRAGYPVRVAVIASQSPDLGSVGALWRHPQAYAAFLGQELSLVDGGRVLVVMPSGLGLYSTAGLSPVERAALATTPRGARGAGTAAGGAAAGGAAAGGAAAGGAAAGGAAAGGADGLGLVDTARIAVQRLARAAGHPLPAGATALAPAAPAGATSTGVVTALAFLIGLGLIAAAWTASLRAHPLTRPGTAAASASARPPE